MTIPKTTISEASTVLVTGAAGFIGYHLSRALLDRGDTVVGLDNLNDYYDPTVKGQRLSLLEREADFTFVRGDVASMEDVAEVFGKTRPQVVVHLAGQAGVRHSIDNPDIYTQSNLVGFANILQAVRTREVRHLLYASSSSVYGGNTKVPFEETDPVDHPVSYYAATKRANELMADAYAHLYRIPTTGLRFFTVYGPLGRPDMAYYRFLDLFRAGEPIRLFNEGKPENDLWRDFTFVDDVVIGILGLMDVPPSGEPPHRVVNVGNNNPVSLIEFVDTLEACLKDTLGASAEFERRHEPMQAGDVRKTFASTALLRELTGYAPGTPLREGLQRFVDWYVDNHGMR